MTPRDASAALSIGAVVKVFFDSHEETVLVASIDSDGILCRPVSARADESAPEFWLAYVQISRIEKVDR